MALLEDFTLELGYPHKGKLCGVCLDHENSHIEVAILAMNGDSIDVNRVMARGCWNVELRAMCGMIPEDDTFPISHVRRVS
jgi:hypothetical protein